MSENVKITRFSDIPMFTRAPAYRANMSWEHIQDNLDRWHANYNLNIDPDFQREHVWTEHQQIKYIEFRLKGGQSGRDILFNDPNWMGKGKTPHDLVLVDGKQRLEAVRRFMADEIQVFGSFKSEFDDALDIINIDFIFHVNNLKTRAEVLQWYVDLNAGGTQHKDEEIQKVVDLLKAESEKNTPKMSRP
jgi:uncharacterized protein with ParB-like and HNH nuclease domain